MALKLSTQYDGGTTTRSMQGTGISTGRFEQTDSVGAYADVSCMMGTAAGAVGTGDLLVLGRCPDKAFVLGIFSTKTVGTVGFIDSIDDTTLNQATGNVKLGFLDASSGADPGKHNNANPINAKYLVYRPGAAMAQDDRVVVLLAQ